MIDKDRASALLAAELGAERLVILTDVPAVLRGFGTDDEQEVRELSPADAETLAVELAEGSMQPKVEASLAYARATGGEALITSPDSLTNALSGNAGTRISKR